MGICFHIFFSLKKPRRGRRGNDSLAENEESAVRRDRIEFFPEVFPQKKLECTQPELFRGGR
ncbi:hypothetical protein DRQ07_10080 [candidate division KSB1 bacterium]|nr:MAG: hypothetical protein DRQ07_10080 [candidate division KSB1 bacterium]